MSFDEKYIKRSILTVNEYIIRKEDCCGRHSFDNIRIDVCSFKYVDN